MQKHKFSYSVLIFGYAFLYIPLITLIFYSFNASRQVTIWGGFSTKWYKALWQNETLLSAAWVSLKVATLSATLAVIIGVLASLVIVKFNKFKSKTFFNTLVAAPMLIPEVIIGLALLLLFVNLEKLFGWPKGGIQTITIAHATISIAYVTAIVTTRLSNVDPLFLEAAQDLGAHPIKAFFVITLPLIYPSIISGWLLSFVLSFDDVVVASFVSGPESSTLPMVIFSSIRFGLTPQVNALATLMISFVVIIIIGASILNDRQKKILTNLDETDETPTI